MKYDSMETTQAERILNERRRYGDRPLTSIRFR